MLRILCLITLLAGSTVAQAHGDNDSVVHRAFWFSGNGTPVLDGFGDCVRNGSWEALGGPKCSLETAELELEVVEVAPAEAVVIEETVAKVAPVPKPEVVVEPAAVVEPEVVVETSTESLMASQPEAAVVTYSYPVEQITANVYFDFDKNNLRVDQQENIELAMIDASKAYKIFKVSLGGHTDSVGTDEYNYDLSQRRINTVVNYLNLRGVEANSTMAWGEQQLVFNADGSENDELSRRVELVFKVQQKVAN
ncbi:OmpA family protein [Oceanospirillaceae bacterium]|nr:OmpA family protein [Oceanospirillaceae bacterium]